MASSLFPKPSTIFIGASTDWDAALVIIKQMSSYLRRMYACTNCDKTINGQLAHVNFILTAIGYDSQDQLNNEADWQDGIECAYKLLYPLT